MSTVVVSRSGSVGSSDDLLSNGSLDLDVLSDGESKDGSRRVERESVAVSRRREKARVSSGRTMEEETELGFEAK